MLKNIQQFHSTVLNRLHYKLSVLLDTGIFFNYLKIILMLQEVLKICMFSISFKNFDEVMTFHRDFPRKICCLNTCLKTAQ